MINFLKFLFLSSVLFGCATTPKEKIIQNDVQVVLKHVETLPNKFGKPQLARTTVGDGFCIIELINYPKCLLHEVRHCFEGNWHEGRETTKDC